MERDLDDTIIGPARPAQPVLPFDDSDTVVRARRPDAQSQDAGAPTGAETRPAAAQYAFMVNFHDPIALDRPAYVGRRPSPPRVADGHRPRLVRVPSPLGEVSSTHLELRQQGTMVIATDLKSTNGTRVRLPGAAPVRLRGSESIVVTPGSLIEIGDGNVIEILSLRRAHPSSPTPGAATS